MKCKLVDVFTTQKFSGNGLAIFSDFDNLSTSDMLVLTQEMRQYESIFLTHDAGCFSAKIFTVEEELDFAGHPLLGLAYHLHEEFATEAQHDWKVKLNNKTVSLSSVWEEGEFTAMLNQGAPIFSKTLSAAESTDLYAALNLDEFKLANYPAAVISTGLPYMILPVAGGLEMLSFKVANLAPLLEPHRAKFLYVLDVTSFEARSWDNAGKIEDIATGSAAGPAAAYLYQHGLVEAGEVLIQQGRFVGRPSQIKVNLLCDGERVTEIKVSGNVVKVADVSFAS